MGENKEIVQQFSSYLRAQNYSQNYVHPAKIYLNFCNENGIDFSQITLINLHSFINTLQERKFAIESINLYIKAVKKLYVFLKDNEICDKTETLSKIRLLKTERKIADYITKEEMDEMLWLAGNFYITALDFNKMKTILYLVFYTGIRLGEFLNLKRANFNLDTNSAIIRLPTKNGQEKVVFFPNTVKELLERYFGGEEEKTNAFNITKGQVNYMVNILSKLTDKHFSFHTLRHSFAMLLVDKEVDVRVAQKLLGHKSINNTLIYYDPDINSISKIYKSKIK